MLKQVNERCEEFVTTETTEAVFKRVIEYDMKILAILSRMKSENGTRKTKRNLRSGYHPPCYNRATAKRGAQREKDDEHKGEEEAQRLEEAEEQRKKRGGGAEKETGGKAQE